MSGVARARGDGWGGEYVGFEAGGDGGGTGAGALGGGGESLEDDRGGYGELTAGEGSVIFGVDCVERRCYLRSQQDDCDYWQEEIIERPIHWLRHVLVRYKSAFVWKK